MQKADRQSRIILTFIKLDIKRLIIKLHDNLPYVNICQFTISIQFYYSNKAVQSLGKQPVKTKCLRLTDGADVDFVTKSKNHFLTGVTGWLGAHKKSKLFHKNFSASKFTKRH